MADSIEALRKTVSELKKNNDKILDIAREVKEIVSVSNKHQFFTWRTDCPDSGETVLFISKTEGIAYMGHWHEHYMLDHRGEGICHPDNVSRWVPLMDVLSTIKE